MFQIFGINQPPQIKPSSLLSAIWDPNRTRESLALVVSRILTFAIAIIGLFFFVRLVSAGYGYLTNAGDQNKIQNASKELTNALIGLLLVISAFFIIQAIQTIFGINILNIS